MCPGTQRPEAVRSSSALLSMSCIHKELAAQPAPLRDVFLRAGRQDKLQAVVQGRHAPPVPGPAPLNYLGSNGAEQCGWLDCRRKGRAPVKLGVGRKRNRPPETLCPRRGREDEAMSQLVAVPSTQTFGTLLKHW